MLKEAKYPCWGYSCKDLPGFEEVAREFPEFNKVVYTIIGNRCYFSGIERKKRTSTINAAESIIKAIAVQEGRYVTAFTYFDIQTYKGYQKFPGEYVVNKLTIDMRPGTKRENVVEKVEIEGESGVMITHGQEDFVVTSWEQTMLSVDVLNLFREYIGVNLKTMHARVYYKSEGLFCVQDENGRFFYICEDGTPIFKERYFDLTVFKDGLAWACSSENYKWAQIDHHGVVKSEWIDREEFFGEK